MQDLGIAWEVKREIYRASQRMNTNLLQQYERLVGGWFRHGLIQSARSAAHKAARKQIAKKLEKALAIVLSQLSETERSYLAKVPNDVCNKWVLALQPLSAIIGHPYSPLGWFEHVLLLLCWRSISMDVCSIGWRRGCLLRCLFSPIQTRTTHGEMLQHKQQSNESE